MHWRHGIKLLFSRSGVLRILHTFVPLLVYNPMHVHVYVVGLCTICRFMINKLIHTHNTGLFVVISIEFS